MNRPVMGSTSDIPEIHVLMDEIERLSQKLRVAEQDFAIQSNAFRDLEEHLALRTAQVNEYEPRMRQAEERVESLEKTAGEFVLMLVRYSPHHLHTPAGKRLMDALGMKKPNA